MKKFIKTLLIALTMLFVVDTTAYADEATENVKESITIKLQEKNSGWVDYISDEGVVRSSAKLSIFYIDDSIYINNNEVISLPFVEKINLEYSQRGRLRMLIIFMNGSQILIKCAAMDASLQRINEEDSGEVNLFDYPDLVPIRLLYEQAGYTVDYNHNDLETVSIHGMNS